MKILLNSSRSKKSYNSSLSTNIQLKGNTKVLPFNDISGIISASEQYQKERESSTKYRLSFQVNVISSNVLNNDVTEIVYKEGSDNAKCLNYGVNEQDIRDIEVIGKGASNYFQSRVTGQYYSYNMVRDSQITRFNNIVYHCGKDIFNNHLIRSNTFKITNFTNNDSDNFNTIEDNLRNHTGNIVEDKLYLPVGGEKNGTNNATLKLHTYEYDDIDTYDGALENKMKVSFNGWVGFNNTAKMKSYSRDGGILNINLPINSKKENNFIDLYPSRELFSFVPIFNHSRQRIEKNWNYCITYPSKSIIDGVGFIETSIYEDTGIPVNSLKAVMFDETTKNDNKSNQIVIYSMIKHGLISGDMVNLYLTYLEKTSLVGAPFEVDTVIDDYIFTVRSNGQNISDLWVDASDLPNGYTKEGSYIKHDGEKFIITYSNHANVDVAKQNLSFKKIDNGEECEYYVRIFSKLPNFKFYNGELNESILYAPGSSLLNQYQNHDSEFESHVTKNGFSRNVFNDKNAQIIFTDDIDIKYIKDNRGRPLTELYLTVVKNNRGYKEWYGLNKQVDCGSENVEYSHCFGKVNCAFKLSDDAMYHQNVPNVSTLQNFATYQVGGNGILLDKINEYVADNSNRDEIDYYNQESFIGDVVCYHPMELTEQSLQQVNHRFNTAQRELQTIASTYKHYSEMYIDNIATDDYDYDDFTVDREQKKLHEKKEGYYYYPHYKIPLRHFGEIHTETPQRMFVKKWVRDGDVYKVNVSGRHNLLVGDKILIYDDASQKTYTATVDDIINKNTFSCDIVDKDNFAVTLKDWNSEEETYKFLKISNTNAPSYAELMKDGSCRLVWRDIFNNSTKVSSIEEEEYPFTNGCFYINKNIVIYNRRQDPDGKYGLYSENFPSDIPGKIISEIEDDIIVEPENILC